MSDIVGGFYLNGKIVKFYMLNTVLFTQLLVNKNSVSFHDDYLSSLFQHINSPKSLLMNFLTFSTL